MTGMTVTDPGDVIMNTSPVYNWTESLVESLEQEYYRPEADQVQRTLELVVRSMDLYYTPVVGILGIVCNFVGVYVFSREPLCYVSTSHYILAILISNAFYLLVTLHNWLNEYGIYFYQIGGWCQFMMFVKQSADFTSTWTLVAICVDRFVAIRFPRSETEFCTVGRARLVIISLNILAIVVYLNISIMYGVLQIGPRLYCTILAQFMVTFQKLSHIDSIVNSMLPCIVLLVLVGVMLYQKVQDSFDECWIKRDTNDHSQRPVTGFDDDEIDMDEDRPCLFLIACFILFNFPLHVSRLYFSIRTMTSESFHMTLKDFLWQQLFVYVKYTSFALNLLVMLLTHGVVKHKLRTLAITCAKLHASCFQHQSRGDTEAPADGEMRALGDEAEDTTTYFLS